MCQVFRLSIATHQTGPEHRGLKSPFSYTLRFCRSGTGAGLSSTSLQFTFMWHQLKVLNVLSWWLGLSGGSRWLDSRVWHLGGNGTRLGVAETADCIVA